MSNCVCECCGKSGNDIANKYDKPKYNEEYHMYLCGSCSVKMDNSVEEYEEKKRRKLQQDNEY